GEFVRVKIRIDCTNALVNHLDITYVRVKYYYA
ncbi:unnamed protein product, partial [marine sediment metagenome]